MAFLLAVVLLPRAADAQNGPHGGGATFGWLSAVADFNADGRPDVAVANRLGNHGSSNFRIEFQISNGRRQSVLFESAQPALKVTAIDVDNDHDIDLVVTPILSHHVIGVWLNDGAGHFSKGRPHDLAPLTAQLSTATLNARAPLVALALPSPRRMTALPPAAARAPDTSLAGTARLTASTDLPSRFLARNLAPRAPPAA